MIFTKQMLTMIGVTAFALGGCATNMGAEHTGEQPVENALQRANADETFDMTKLTCWELSTLPEVDAGYAAVLLYGYNAGQSGRREHTGTRIEGAIVKAMETCAASPNMMAIQAFK